MVTLLGLGVVDLVLYYLGVLPGSSVWWLIVGFILIAGGFVTGVFWR
jgi:hypothetical protein